MPPTQKDPRTAASSSTRRLLLASLFCLGCVHSLPLNVTILHVNDHHSHLVDEARLDLEGDHVPTGLGVNTSDLRIYYGGFARIVGLVKDLQTQARARGDGVLTLHAGDAMTGTLFYSIYGPEADAAALNAANVWDALVLGNHEFDGGDTQVAEFATTTDVPFLSYNLNPAPNSPLRQLQGSDSEIRPYLIRTFANGERLGICGLTTKVITEQASNPDPGTTLDDEAQAAATCVSELEGMGIDKIVLLAHTGFASDVDNYASIPGVDVVVGGHSHSLLGGPELEIQGLSPVGTYAGMTESGVCIVHGWEFAKLVGELKVAFDDAGNVVSCTGGPRFPLNPDRMDLNDAAEDAEDKELGEADRAIVVANLTSYPHWVLATPDTDVETVLKPYNDDIQSLLLSPIAPVPENICHTRRGDGIDEQCPNKPEISLLNGGVCPLVAQSFLYNALTADFALQNAGGCRTDILSGELTLGEAYELLPFSNNLVTLRLTGEQIVRSLEDGLSFYMDVKAGSGSFPNTAGLRYDIDLTAEKGSRVSNIEMNPRLEGEWEPLDLERSFVVVTTDFLATPRDGYDTLGEVDKGDEDQFVSLYIAYAQSLINYMSALGIVEEVAPDTYPL